MVGFSELLARARQQDEEALGELHRRYAPRVFARVRQRLNAPLRRRYDTMDLSQSVFVEVLKDLPRFEDRGEKAFRNWLYIKAENKVRMKLRRFLDRSGRRREGTLGSAHEEALPAHVRDPLSEAGIREGTDRLRAAMEALPESQREVLHLRGREKLSYAEIAERVGAASANAARRRHARALSALRKAWMGI